METIIGTEILLDHASNLGVDVDFAKDWLSEFESNPYNNDRGIAPIKCAMILCTLDHLQIDHTQVVKDSKMVPRSSSALMTDHIWKYVNAAHARGAGGRRIPLSLTAEILMDITDDDDPQWQHMIMAASGNFGYDKRFGAYVIELIEEAESEEIIILPDDIGHGMGYDITTNGDAEWYYGYPIDYDPKSEVLTLRCFIKDIDGDWSAIDHNINLPASAATTFANRACGDLVDGGPIRTSMITVVTTNNTYWGAFPTRYMRYTGENICSQLKDKLGLIATGTDSNGFDLGDAYVQHTIGKGWETGICYWGGLAKWPDHHTLSHARIFWQINIKDFSIDLLGTEKYWTSEYLNCRQPQPNTGHQFRILPFTIEYYEELRKVKSEILDLIKLSSKKTVHISNVIKWLKAVEWTKDRIAAARVVLHQKSKDDFISPWTAAITIAAQERGSDPIWRRRVSMAAGDLILLSPLIGHKELTWTGALTNS